MPLCHPNGAAAQQIGSVLSLALSCTTRLAAEADTAATILAQRLLLCAFAPPAQPLLDALAQRRVVDLSQRQLIAATLFVGAVEAAWQTSRRAGAALPRSVAAVLHSLLRPVNASLAVARRGVWLSATFLALRAVQRHCVTFSDVPASVLRHGISAANSFMSSRPPSPGYDTAGPSASHSQHGGDYSQRGAYACARGRGAEEPPPWADEEAGFSERGLSMRVTRVHDDPAVDETPRHVGQGDMWAVETASGLGRHLGPSGLLGQAQTQPFGSVEEVRDRHGALCSHSPHARSNVSSAPSAPPWPGDGM